jgi:two-component system, cell cycle response regulator
MGKSQKDMTMRMDPAKIAEALRPQKSKQAFFIVIGGDRVGEVLPLTAEVTVIGRDAACGIALPGEGVSRRHAEVRRDGPEQVFIRDLGSTNGTYVSGAQIEEAQLRDGDKVLIGSKTILKFVLQDELEEKYQREIYESSVRDPLTGVFNRKYFDNQLRALASFARRHQVPLTLIIFDLDHFKKVNDTHGHQAGDQVLVAVSGAVGSRIRTEDVLARYGGEEFVIIALGLERQDGLAFAERVRRQVEVLSVPLPGGGALRVTISVGVATAPAGADVDPSTLVARADGNLYEAKHQGRNRVVASCAGPPR